MSRYVLPVIALVTILVDAFTLGVAHAITFTLGTITGMCVLACWRAGTGRFTAPCAGKSERRPRAGNPSNRKIYGMSQRSELHDRIRAVADPLIADGRDNMEVRSEILAQLGIGIGGGGGGTDPSIPPCKVCGANGGGGHGGLCPDGSGWE